MNKASLSVKVSYLKLHFHVLSHSLFIPKLFWFYQLDLSKSYILHNYYIAIIIYFCCLNFCYNLVPFQSFRLFLNSSLLYTSYMFEVDCDIYQILFDYPSRFSPNLYNHFLFFHLSFMIILFPTSNSSKLIYSSRCFEIKI